MNGMKIDLRTIKVWVSKWEKNNGIGKDSITIGCCDAMQSLEENEKRIVRIEKLMREIIRESETLRKMERELLADSRSKGANELELESELKIIGQRL